MNLAILSGGTLGASVLAGVMLVTPAAAESPGAAASATAHALDEQANCFAQHRPECPTYTPPATPTPTQTPTPAPNATATLEQTLAPVDDTPTPAPTPCFAVDREMGDPNNAYVVFDENTGDPLPCASPTATQEPTDAPTQTPTLTATPSPTSAVQIVYIRQPAPQPQVVYVQVTAAPRVEYVYPPTATPLPTATPSPTRSPTPTRPTSTRTLTPTPSHTPTSRPAPTQIPPPSPVNEDVPPPAPPPRQPVPVDHMPLPMLTSFGLLAITRKEDMPPWHLPMPSSD